MSQLIHHDSPCGIRGVRPVWDLGGQDSEEKKHLRVFFQEKFVNRNRSHQTVQIFGLIIPFWGIYDKETAQKEKECPKIFLL